ncbi:MAG: RecX family transcriptional regulator [Brevibacillus sp.]|nr:RecX family transcriptional regulator [Brevibacillus sp.]
MSSGLISAVRRDTKQRDRYHIYIDGEFAFSVHEDILIKYNLLKGTPVDGGLHEEVLQAEERHKAYLTALRLLGIRPRTAAQLEQYLTDKGYSSAIAREVRLLCEERGYIDDRDYARRWVAERIRNRPRGRYALKMELMQKGISMDIAEAALSELDQREELEAARRWLSKRLRREAELPSDSRQLQKILVALTRKGFSHAVVKAVRKELQEGRFPCAADEEREQ